MEGLASNKTFSRVVAYFGPWFSIDLMDLKVQVPISEKMKIKSLKIIYGPGKNSYGSGTKQNITQFSSKK